jgi:hypothetical protein
MLEYFIKKLESHEISVTLFEAYELQYSSFWLLYQSHSQGFQGVYQIGKITSLGLNECTDPIAFTYIIYN